MVYGMEYTFGQSGSAVTAVFPLSLLPTPIYSLGASMTNTEGLDTVQPAVWQQLKHWGVISAVLITNLKHGTLWAAMKKITPPQPNPVLSAN